PLQFMSTRPGTVDVLDQGRGNGDGLTACRRDLSVSLSPLGGEFLIIRSSTLSGHQLDVTREGIRKKQMAAKLECINPILPVRDIKVSLNYYVSVLGFEKADWVREDSTFALVSRDGCGIY